MQDVILVLLLKVKDLGNYRVNEAHTHTHNLLSFTTSCLQVQIRYTRI